MHTSTLNLSLNQDTELSQFSAHELINEAQNAPRNLNPEVIFLACPDLNEQIGSNLGFSVFECNDLHDFLRNGLIKIHLFGNTRRASRMQFTKAQRIIIRTNKTSVCNYCT